MSTARHMDADLAPWTKCPNLPDSSTPRFGYNDDHLAKIAAANAGRGFPFVTDLPVRHDPRPPGGLKGLAATVARDYRIRPEDLGSKCRERWISWPRQDFMWRARKIVWPDGSPRYSLPMIARFLGLECHSSVIHGVRAHQARLDGLDGHAS
jgi:hypothetical protein